MTTLAKPGRLANDNNLNFHPSITNHYFLIVVLVFFLLDNRLGKLQPSFFFYTRNSLEIIHMAKVCRVS